MNTREGRAARQLKLAKTNGNHECIEFEMTVRIQDFAAITNVNTISELEQLLQKRYCNDANSFWLSHNDESKPSMSLLVKGDIAYLHYFPSESHPGFASSRNDENLIDGTTIFFLDSPDQEQEILNSSVVSFAQALKAATEFFYSKNLPKSINWSEL